VFVNNSEEASKNMTLVVIKIGFTMFTH